MARSAEGGWEPAVSGKAQRKGRLPGGLAGREGPGAGPGEGLGMMGPAGREVPAGGGGGQDARGEGGWGLGGWRGTSPCSASPQLTWVCLSCLLHPVLIHLSVWPLYRAGSNMDCSCVSDLLFAPPALPALWTPGNWPRPAPPFPQPWGLPSPLAPPFCISHCLSSFCPGSGVSVRVA